MKIISHPYASNDILPFPIRLFSVGERFLIEWGLPETGDALTDTPFMKELREKNAVAQIGGRSFTPLLALAEFGAKFKALAPALFIFHATRCGSTLLARMIESHGANRVFIEPRSVITLLLNLPSSRELELKSDLIRSLIGAYGLGAPSGQKKLVFKFASACNFHIEALKAAFPDTPCVFLYRDPVEILVSLVTEPATWLYENGAEILSHILPHLKKELKNLSIEQLACRYLERIFRHMLEQADGSLKLINYTELPQAGIDLARDFLSCDIQEECRDILGRHSKKPGELFVPDTDRKRRLASPMVLELAENYLIPLYRALEKKRIAALTTFL
ncbi:MAG: hypothetical protein HQK57_01735 [Deltaproteobacteria bacterium]|nr:hypothetical protein [Deltaproteobacteria bacterium]